MLRFLCGGNPLAFGMRIVDIRTSFDDGGIFVSLIILDIILDRYSILMDRCLQCDDLFYRVRVDVLLVKLIHIL